MKTLKNKMTWTETTGQIIEGESMTIQGDTIPMIDILQRFTQGIDSPTGGAFYGDVEDDEHESSDYNQVVGADLVDQQEMAEDRIALIEYIDTKKKESKAKEDEGSKKKAETPEE